MTLPITPATCHNAPKPKGPVTQKHHSEAVATPTDKRGFVTPKFWGLVRLHCLMVMGRGGAYPQGWPHDFGRVFDHHAPPAALKNGNGGFLVTPEGAKTMKATTQGTTTPALFTTDPRLYFSAINGLAHALRILTDGELDQAQLHRAIGKTLRSATAIKRMAQTTVEG